MQDEKNNLIKLIYQSYDENISSFFKFKGQFFKIYYDLRRLHGKDVALEFKKIYLEVKKLMEIYQSILMFLLKNIDILDREEGKKIFLEINLSYHNEIKYYQLMFDDIKKKILLNKKKRDLGYSNCVCCYFLKKKKEFISLMDSNIYQRRLIEASFTFEDIKNYLGYPEEFFLEIKPKTYFKPYLKEDLGLYGVCIKENFNHHIIDYRIILPIIQDLDSALITVHELKHAYDIYSLKGSICSDDTLLFEKRAKEMEANFKKYYRTKLKKKI